MSVIGRYEPPDTAWAVPDVELMLPLDACTPDELVEVEVDVLDVDEVEAVEVAFPGRVLALTYPSMPTPATAATVTPTVKRFNSRYAASRMSVFEWIGSVVSMSASLRSAAEAGL